MCSWMYALMCSLKRTVTGSLLSGMSTTMVTPPLAAAAVAPAMVSQPARAPAGSFMCTCVSMMPGVHVRAFVIKKASVRGIHWLGFPESDHRHSRRHHHTAKSTHRDPQRCPQSPEPRCLDCLAQSWTRYASYCTQPGCYPSQSASRQSSRRAHETHRPPSSCHARCCSKTRRTPGMERHHTGPRI